MLILCQNKIHVNIELKDSNTLETAKLVSELVEKYHMAEQINFSSFNFQYYNDFQQISPNRYQFGFLYEHEDIEKLDFSHPGQSLNIGMHIVNEEIVTKAKKAGMSIMAYIDSENGEENEELYLLCFKLGVDIICVNYPEMAIKCREAFFNSK